MSVENLKGDFMPINFEDISIVEISNKKDLLPFYDQISDLFSECFGRKLESDLWNWAYQDNPFGHPIVSLALYDGRVVGHYAVIPFDLRSLNGKKVNAFLSMTTMVAEKFRRHRLFPILAKQVYSYIEKSNIRSIVFGFPNKNSISGFKKRLGWTIEENIRLLSVPYSEIDKVEDIVTKNWTDDRLTVDLSSKDIQEWRKNKPRQKWCVKEGIAYKKFDDMKDVMYLECPSGLSNMESCQSFNIILEVADNNLGKELFSYRFGYRAFHFSSEPKFFVQMCMSDVF